MQNWSNLPFAVEDMSFQQYLDDPMPAPSLSGSTIKDVLGTAPKKVWQNNRRLNPDFVNDEKYIFDLGEAAHKAFTGMGNELVLIEADSYRTKAAKTMRDDARIAGRVPILEKDFERVSKMALTANLYFGENPDIGPLIKNRSGLYPEISIFWQESTVFCRCRPDLYCEPPLGIPVVLHYKTTGLSVNPHHVNRLAAQQGWDLTAAHYEEGVKALTGKRPNQYFLVQEVTPPHLCLVVTLDELFIEPAALMREKALEIWAECLATEKWPPYSMNTVMLYPPSWHETAVQAISADSGGYLPAQDALTDWAGLYKGVKDND